MKIKLIKDAIIEGVAAKKNSTHDLIDRIGEKLIARGYAMIDDGKKPTKKDVTDDGATSK